MADKKALSTPLRVIKTAFLSIFVAPLTKEPLNTHYHTGCQQQHPTFLLTTTFPGHLLIYTTTFNVPTDYSVNSALHYMPATTEFLHTWLTTVYLNNPLSPADNSILEGYLTPATTAFIHSCNIWLTIFHLRNPLSPADNSIYFALHYTGNNCIFPQL